ncbi:MAG: rhomboid family protein [Kiritimatiellae bacterium]|nr:rhomboid family protein [Kiritimatiellia bacterium]
MRLHEQRCERHSEREAAARCPACGHFFCRECIVEHDGRVLCATCLAAQAAAPASGKGRGAFKPLAWCAALAGFLALWLVYATVGRLLLLLPADFHEGRYWERGTERD